VHFNFSTALREYAPSEMPAYGSPSHCDWPVEAITPFTWWDENVAPICPEPSRTWSVKPIRELVSIGGSAISQKHTGRRVKT
jgi:hypothetical protein